MNAQIGLDKWEKRTRLLQWLLVPVSVPMAYRLFAACEERTLGVNLGLCIWLVTFVALCVCAEAAWRAHKRLDRMLSAAGGRRR